jgi:hypothetical protein
MGLLYTISIQGSPVPLLKFQIWEILLSYCVWCWIYICVFLELNTLQKKSISPTSTGPDGWWILKYLRLLDDICTDLSSYWQFFVTAVILCTTNQRSISFRYLLHMLVEGHQTPMLCFLESSYKKKIGGTGNKQSGSATRVDVQIICNRRWQISKYLFHRFKDQ